MKSFRTYLLTAVAVLALTMTMTACSKKSSDSGGTTVSAITTTTQGQQAAAAGTQGASMSQGSGQTFRNLGNVGLSSTGTGVPEFKSSTIFKPSGAMAKIIKSSEKFAKSSAARSAANSVKRAAGALKAQIAGAPTTGSGTCADGGTYDYSVTASSSTSFSADITFHNCRESDTQMNGLYKLTGSVSGASPNESVVLTITLGTTATPFTILDYSASYSALAAETSMTAFALGFKATSTATSLTLDMTASGTMNFHDYFADEDYSIEYTNNFDQVVGISTAMTGSTLNSLTLDFTTNGDFKEVWNAASTTNTVAASFSAFKVDLTLAGLASPPTATVPYEELNINGQFSITFTPENCMSGTYKFVTSPPIRASLETGKTYQGVLTINDTTTVTFNADGTITVTTAGVSKNYTNEYDLALECQIATVGGNSSPSTTTVASNATYTATGGVTITLTWNKLNDMDLHLAHYVTKPTTTATMPTNSSTGVTTNSDWHLYYGTGPGHACSSGNYIGTSSNMIAELDIDKCSSEGYGPEHITMATPPSGYYIMFVDAYSASEATTVDVSLQAGDKVFSFPSHVFASSADPNYIVGAFSVDASGNITIYASAMANTINYAGALRAPKF